MVAIFNIFDTIGRKLGGIKSLSLSKRGIIILSLSRTVFIATSLLVAYKEDPVWLFGSQADWFKILNLILFAVTNGYTST